jgi:hypothetical protein
LYGEGKVSLEEPKADPFVVPDVYGREVGRIRFNEI